MSFIKKTMANVLGIGGTKVDTILSTNLVVPGESLQGVINIYGGEVEQYLQGVYIDIKTNYEKEYDDKKIIVESTVQRFAVKIDNSISPNKNLSIPFSFILDLNCPISLGKSKVWVTTQLDIERAIDDTDGDGLKVNPNSYMNVIFNAIAELGFRMSTCKNIYDKHRFNHNKFVQEFEYLPTSGVFRGKLDEIEVVLVADDLGISVFIEVDRKVRGLGSLISEKLSLDQSLVKVNFNYDELSDISYVSRKLFNVIKDYC